MSKLADKWYSLWRQCGGPHLHREVRFHPTRKWRFDFALFDPHWIAFEVDGGEFIFGRHARRLGADAEKANAAQVLGWMIIRFPTSLCREEYIRHILGHLPTRCRPRPTYQPSGTHQGGVLHGQGKGNRGQQAAGRLAPKAGTKASKQRFHLRKGKEIR